jgi:hypothetical protein
MIRKLLLPALLVGLLGGCVSAGYSYRDGYYYGQPSVDYRYHDYGYPGGYYPYGYGYYPYGERYRYYNYYSPYYYGRYPYYYNHHYRRPRPPVTGTPTPTPNPDPQPGHDRDGDRPPWRDLDRRRRGDIVRDTLPSRPEPRVRQAPRRESRDEGSGMGQVMRRAQESRRRNSGGSQER